MILALTFAVGVIFGCFLTVVLAILAEVDGY
jgi:hypothetical protein